MVVDALKNVVRTFFSLLFVGLIIYGGIYFINERRSSEDTEDIIVEDDNTNEEEIEDEKPEEEKPQQFQTITYRDPVIRETENSFSRTGVINLDDKVDIGSDLSSNVESINVAIGDFVSKGDVLFTLQENTTTKQLAINLNTAEKQLANAYRSLDLTRHTANISEGSYQIQMKTADLALQQAILSLDSTRDIAARQIGLEDMGSEVEEIGTEISANTPSIEKTVGQLVNTGLSEFIGSDLENQYDFESAQEDLQNAQGNLKYGQRQLTVAQNYYADIRNFQQIDNAKLQIESLRNQISNQRVATDLNINQVLSQINQAESQVALARLQLDQTKITAPVSGTVLNIDLTIGEKTSPGVNYMSISSQMKKKISVFVSIEQASKLKKDQTVEIVYSGNKYNAKVESIALTANPSSRLIEVKIGDLNDNGDLIANAFARVNFLDNDSSDQIISATVVPFRKLKIEGNNYFAPVLVGEDIEFKQVEVAGPIRSGNIQLVGGLTNGDEVVVSESTSLITMN